MNTNYVRSGASGRIWDNVEQRFVRESLSGYRDFADYSLSLSFEPTFSTFYYLLERMLYHPHEPIRVSFDDANYSINYDFDTAYLVKVDFSVNNGSVCSMNVDFKIFKQTIEVSKAHPLNKGGFNEGGESAKLAGTQMMPYYYFGVDYDDKRVDSSELVSITFSVQQDIEAKMGCVGIESNNPDKEPMYLVFGKQSADYSLSYLYCKPEGASNGSSDNNNSDNAVTELTEEQTLTVKYKDFRIQCGQCFVDSYSPQLADKSGYNSIQLNGTVYGKITLNS